jgi:purine-nucleoside phosphorylase
MMTASSDLLQMTDDAAASVKEALGDVPPVLVVTGSGLGPFASTVENAVKVGYEKLRHFPVSTVVGHAGNLVKGTLGGKPLLVMSGRKHLYEGVDVTVATLPLRALLRAGVKTVILSNAAGGLNPRFDVGNLMLITDHVNFQFRNPLIGKNIDEMGPRFPDMSEPYSRELQKLARDTAQELGLLLREGVYVAGLGPSYETYAEVDMFRSFADAVGMSTVPETTLAVHAGARVLGISLITNSLVKRTHAQVTHEEVMETAREASDRFCKLVGKIIQKL